MSDPSLAPVADKFARFQRFKPYLGPALILLCALAMLWHTWLKWPDLRIDFGLQLYTPWRLSQGALLYRDVASLYGPFSSYANSLLFRVFGPSLLALAMVNFCIFLGLLAMLYAIAAYIADRTSATIACLVVVFLCGFNQYVDIGNYTFVTPYSHEATHSFTLAVAAIFTMMQFAKSGRSVWLFVAGVCVGTSALAKPESSLAAAGASALGLMLLVWPKSSWARFARRTGLFLLGIVLPLVISLLLFGRVVTWPEAFRSTFAAWITASNSSLRHVALYTQWMGTNDLPNNILVMILSAFKYLLVIALLAAVPLLLAGRMASRPHRFIISIFVACAVCLLFGLMGGQDFWLEIGRPFPIAIAVLLAIFACVYIRKPASRTGVGPLRLIFLLFAILMLLRMFFNTRVYHFGFVLTPPTLICLTLLLTYWIPKKLNAYRKGSGELYRAAAVVLFLATICVFMSVSEGKYSKKTVRVGSGSNSFYTNLIGVYFNQLLKDIQFNTRPDQTISVFPENLMVNYLSGRIAPTRYIQFTPSELVAYGEETILDALRKHPPDFIVLVHRDTSEYGVRFFSRDYALQIGKWISNNYTPAEEPLGAMPFNDRNDFGILVLAPKTPPASAPSTSPHN